MSATRGEAPDDPLVEPALTRRGGQRLDMIDALRGLVIALMVLDHVRDFFHVQALAFDPTNLDRTTAALFATRWITHLCAPTFVFLAGVAVFLQGAGGRSRPDLSRFLLTRGAWLLLLELTVIAFGFNFAWPFLFLQVIWAIGIGMVALAALVWLPRVAVLALGALIVAGHGLLAPVDAADLGALGPLWTLAMEPGVVPGVTGFVAYPALPWVGMLFLGYGLGPVFLLDPSRRRRVVAALGVGALAAFALLRGFSAFGDPRAWDTGADGLKSLLSFVNVSKYPPSLLFVLVMLGTALLVMLLLERLRGLAQRVLLAFGRTPLFTYLLHIYLVHGLALAVGAASGTPASAFVNFLGDPGRLIATGWGVGLLAVYAIWALILAALYPAARWFAGVKRRRRDWWLGYV